MLGDRDSEISTVYLSLDIDENIIKEASENSLIITHHPLIFKGLKDLYDKTYPRAFIKEMICKNISLISISKLRFKSFKYLFYGRNFRF